MGVVSNVITKKKMFTPLFTVSNKVVLMNTVLSDKILTFSVE